MVKILDFLSNIIILHVTSDSDAVLYRHGEVATTSSYESVKGALRLRSLNVLI